MRPIVKLIIMTLLRCKVVIVGDPHVGKSATTQIFLSNVYPDNYIMVCPYVHIFTSHHYLCNRLGVDFSVKSVPIPGSSNTFEVYLFDLSGEPIYSDLVQLCVIDSIQSLSPI
jgi:GTPase SAR1 family protein